MFFTQKHKSGEKSAVDWTAFARLAGENAAIGALRDVTDIYGAEIVGDSSPPAFARQTTLISLFPVVAKESRHFSQILAIFLKNGIRRSNTKP